MFYEAGSAIFPWTSNAMLVRTLTELRSIKLAGTQCENVVLRVLFRALTGKAIINVSARIAHPAALGMGNGQEEKAVKDHLSGYRSPLQDV